MILSQPRPETERGRGRPRQWSKPVVRHRLETVAPIWIYSKSWECLVNGGSDEQGDA
jgi:hypothetical protein